MPVNIGKPHIFVAVPASDLENWKSSNNHQDRRESDSVQTWRCLRLQVVLYSCYPLCRFPGCHYNFHLFDTRFSSFEVWQSENFSWLPLSGKLNQYNSRGPGRDSIRWQDIFVILSTKSILLANNLQIYITVTQWPDIFVILPTKSILLAMNLSLLKERESIFGGISSWAEQELLKLQQLMWCNDVLSLVCQSRGLVGECWRLNAIS